MTSREIVFSPLAVRDIAAIIEYVRKENPLAATHLSIKIIAACDSLESYPHRGRIGLEAGTRELVCIRPYIIIYRISRDFIEIVNIFHSARDR